MQPFTEGGPSLTGILFGVLGEEEEDGGGEDVLDGAVRGAGPRGPGGTASEAQLARRLTKGKGRRILSNKPQDFQVGMAWAPPILFLPLYRPASGNCGDVRKDLFLRAVARLVKEYVRHKPNKKSCPSSACRRRCSQAR